ncbi:MAG: hypothetical protein ABIH39_06600 [Candidatus Margulisiibacteriota bacterium]
MNFQEFKKEVREYPFFRSTIFPHLSCNIAVLRNQIREWVKKGYIIKLKRGFYTLNSDDRKAGLSQYFLANNLYSPSYISLETALSYYGLIPEGVYAITSVSTKKTQGFHNDLGDFIYHNIKKELFSDFIQIKDEYGYNYQIASPERALIDFFYFKLSFDKNTGKDVFDISLRLQNLDIIGIKKLKKIAKKYNVKKLDKIVNLFGEYLEENKYV